MADYILALFLKHGSNDEVFLMSKQTPPPKLGDEEYDSFVDSDLWDLPSTKLNPLDSESQNPGISIHGVESFVDKIDLTKFNFDFAVDKILEQVGLEPSDVEEWRIYKFVEEPEFGPGMVHTLYVTGKLATDSRILPEVSKWMSVENCRCLLVDVKPGSERVGPLVTIGLLNNKEEFSETKVNTSLNYQEYPPGVILVPMRSRTQKPFCTTNLIIFASVNVSNECENNKFLAHGDALIVDPGCQADFHGELFKIVAALSRKLIVFVTHHHCDHVDGLSVIQKCNPRATLLAHENTMRRIGKGDWSLGYTSVSGGETICIGDQQLRVIFAPGHTDGHVALVHVNSHSLIVGDHCVGQGSAVLDINSGGCMSDYFESTYKFIEFAPHFLIPMHGRINLWPKNMLCRYLENRRSRETSILNAIRNGAKTLFDIVSDVYSGVDRSLWIPAASNVRLHVEHLVQQKMLPEGFSIDTFNRSIVSFGDEVFKSNI